MEIAVLLIGLIACITIIAIKLSQPVLDFPFNSKSKLYTGAERQFLPSIEHAVQGEFRVMCRVKLSDIVSLKNNASPKTAKNAMMTAEAKQIDFVLCDKTNMNPIMAIDLVYGSGKDGHNTQRDFFVNGALETASIPHLRIKAKSGYTIDDIKECIETKLVPLRRRQGKTPFTNAPKRKSIIKPHNKPTRPLSADRANIGRAAA